MIIEYKTIPEEGSFKEQKIESVGWELYGIRKKHGNHCNDKKRRTLEPAFLLVFSCNKPLSEFF